MDIPSSIFDVFNDGVDAMLASSMAPTCILVYPPKITECPNCIVNPVTKSSSGQYKSGGPKPFTNGQICPYCQDKGFTETEATDSIKLLIDWEPKENRDIINNNQGTSHNTAKTIAIPGGLIKIQGNMSNVQKVQQAVEFRIHQALSNYDYWRYVRFSEPIPYSLTHNSYFACLLERVG